MSTMEQKTRLKKLEKILLEKVQDPVFEESNINLVEMSAAYRAAKLVLEVECSATPTPEQIIQFSIVAQLNDFKNSAR